MADIELVIKIDNQTYNNFVHNEYSRADVIAMHTALINATPLPKGHGRLIDKDALIGKIHGVKSITAVLDAKTIIEADRSEEV